MVFNPALDTITKERTTRFKGLARQYFTAFCAALCSFSTSACFIWPAPLLVGWKEGRGEVEVTPDQASWIVSLIMLGMMVSTIPAGQLVDRLGRKTLLLATGLILLVGWVLVLTTRSVYVLYLVRIIHGLGLGMMCAALPTYLGEIAGPAVRGSVGYLFQGMWYLGNLYQYVLGPYLSYQTFAWTSLAPCLVFLLTFYWLPESPYYLNMRGRSAEAVEVVAWLAGEENASVDPKEVGITLEKTPQGGWKQLFAEEKKALFLCLLVQASYILCGGTALFSYATETFARTRGSALTPDQVTIVMSSTLLFLMPFSGILADTQGRRPVLLISLIGSFISLGLASVYYYLYFKTNYDLEGYYWAPYCIIVLYSVLIGAGVESVAPVLQAELFSNSSRALAAGLTWFGSAAMSLLALKMYQVLADYVGLYFLYAVFSLFALAGMFAIYFVVPETKGKTFEEIQQMLKAR